MTSLRVLRDESRSPGPRGPRADRGPVRVAVCSPEQVVGAGVMTLLSRHPDRVRVVPLAGAVGQPQPDVILFDVVDLVAGDLDRLRRLVERRGPKVLALSRDLRPDLAATAVAAGAAGWFSLGVDEEALVAAVESACTGWMVGDNGPDPTVGSPHSGTPAIGARPSGVSLTNREIDVLTRIVRGLGNVEIAGELYLSPNSIKTYIRSAYRKIGVRTRSQAVSWAFVHGFGGQVVQAGQGPTADLVRPALVARIPSSPHPPVRRLAAHGTSQVSSA